MAGRMVTGNNAVALALVALLAGAAVSGAAGYTVCGVDTDGMKNACSSYCEAGSREAKPTTQCCDAVRGADFRCLCRFKSVIRSMGNIDAGRTMQIPSKCGIRGAPASCY